MARSFKIRDAKELIANAHDLLSQFDAAATVANKLKNDVRYVTDKIQADKASAIMQTVPVETLNKVRPGTRTKTLKDAGFTTMADIAAASIITLSRVNGISQNAAHDIRGIADQYYASVKNHVRIKLSADNRDKASNELVASLFRRMQARRAMHGVRALEHPYAKHIQHASEDLSAGIGWFKWMFASKDAKSATERAYSYLEKMVCGQYGKDAKRAVLAVERAASIPTEDCWNQFESDPIPFFTELEDISHGVLGNDDTSYGLPEELANEIQKVHISTEGLYCTLRRYQEWGVRYILYRERVLLGDEMGLGKTIQAIAAMVSLRNSGAGNHFVVICPASVLINWCREIEKHSNLVVYKVHNQLVQGTWRLWMDSGRVAVTTYDTLAKLAPVERGAITMVTVDEAHYIKNPNAKRTRTVTALCEKSRRLLFMTGTPLENRVDEMISLIGILRPSMVPMIQSMAYMSAAPAFREKIAPVYYRRKRADVLTELPELIENMEWCAMTRMDEAAYEAAALSRNVMALRRVSWNVGDLRYSSKANRMLEIIEDAKNESRKVLVFSFFLDTLECVRYLLGDRCMPAITGAVPPPRRQEIIDEFDAAPAGTVLPAQIQSGGTGPNIQSASVVIICEPQVKPSIENQAISRAYRMGQSRNVIVYRLLCEGSIDERFTLLLANKQAQFDAFADKSIAAECDAEIDDGAFAEATASEAKAFTQCLNEEIERIQKKNAVLHRKNHTS